MTKDLAHKGKPKSEEFNYCFFFDHFARHDERQRVAKGANHFARQDEQSRVAKGAVKLS